MKQKLLLASIAFGCIIIGCSLCLILANRSTNLAKTGMLDFSVKEHLPADPKSAKKELNRVRRALLNLQPSRPYIVIDTHANKLYLRTDESILLEATCSTGSGGELVDSLTGRRWVFNTPRGVFKISNKIVDPWWRKPDWAFIEEDEAIPKDPRERYDPEMLGEYAMGFGNGYFIHGTLYQRLLGINVTHGCVRLGTEDLKTLYHKVNIGTSVYVF